MIIAGTGHRPDKLWNDYDLKSSRVAAIEFDVAQILINHDVEAVISGMALGFDTILARTAMHLDLPLWAYIPFKGQEKMWPQKSQDYYNLLLKYASRTKVVCDGVYAAWKMQKRNEAMVDNCNTLISLWDGSSGGTANCIKYAGNKIPRIPIIRLNPKDYEHL